MNLNINNDIYEKDNRKELSHNQIEKSEFSKVSKISN